MDNASINIYKAARLEAGLTQEKAAEVLGISDSAVRTYECGTRVPSVDVVERMVVGYNALHLAYQHTASTSNAAQVLPSLEYTDIQTATLRLVNRVLAFADQRRDRSLMMIAENGVIDADEQALFNQIAQEIDGIVKAALELKVAKKRA